MPLHVLGLTPAGNILHTIRTSPPASPGWIPWRSIGTQNPSSPITLMDCTVVNGNELHVCAITEDNRLLHTVRMPNGIWQPTWGDVGQNVGLPNHEFMRVAVTGIGPSLHICASAKPRPRGGGPVPALIWPIYHAIRLSTPPSWTQLLTVVASGLPVRSEVFYGISCARVGGGLQACAIGINNELWHTILPVPGGSWQQFNDVKTVVPGHNNLPGSIDFIGVAGIGAMLHVCAVVGRSIWHTIRINSSGWQSSFVNVNKQMTTGDKFEGVITNMDCANVDGNLHICGVTEAGQIIHTIRTSTPQDWRNPETTTIKGFGNVTAVVGGLGGITPIPSFDLVSIAGF